MQSQTLPCFSVAFFLGACWLVIFSITGSAAQSVNYEQTSSSLTLKEDLPASLSTFLPTAALMNNDQAKHVSQKCVEDSRLLAKAILNRTEWALSIFQASGKVPVDAARSYLISGAKGTLDEPGQFDLCISSKPPSGIFYGQYCSVFVSTIPVTQSLTAKNGPESYIHSFNEKHPTITVATKKENIYDFDNVTDLIIGFCLPSSCSAHDLQFAIAHDIGRTRFQLEKEPDTLVLYSLNTAAHERYCHTKHKIEEQSSFDGLSISFVIVMCIIVGLVLTSTIYKMCGWMFPFIIFTQESTPMQVLKCFSAVDNFRYWLSAKASANDEITCLHGLKALTSLSLPCLHTAGLVFALSRPIDQENMIKLMSQWTHYPLTAIGYLIIDNCLLIGGILSCISLLKDFSRGRFNILRFFIHRFLRLTPLYSMVVFFIATLAGRLGSGPNWNTVHHQSEDCRTYWWSHLLYINNIFHSKITFCMPDTWYSAVDMQLFLLSPLLVFPLWRWPGKIGPVIMFLLMLSASLFYTTIIHLKWDVPLFFMISRASMRKQLQKYFQYYYTQTFNRVPAYLVGIMLGWILHRTKNAQILIKKSILVPIWILSGMILVMIIYGPYLNVNGNTFEVKTPLLELIYGVFYRTGWSLILALIIFLCFHGYGGMLNEFLSSKMFVPISRLSYPIYLVNLTLNTIYLSYLRTPFSVNLLNITIAALGMLAFTLILSVFLFIFIEMPFQNLEKIIRFVPANASSSTKNQAEEASLSSNASSPKMTAKISKGSKEY